VFVVFIAVMTENPVTILSRRPAEVRHGLRIAAAGILSYVAAELLGLPQGYWAVFTAVLVVQGSVGGSWKAAVDRLAGTLFGAIYGAAIATVVPHNDVVMLGIALAISLTPLALLAAFYPSYRVAPITAVVLLLGSAAGAEGPFLAAAMRTLDVSLGGFVGIAGARSVGKRRQSRAAASGRSARRPDRWIARAGGCEGDRRAARCGARRPHRA
jgi:uncharacterized membrane protein YccC